MWLAGSNFQFILGWTWDFLPKSFSFQPKFFMKTIENTMVYHPRISKVRAIRGWINIYGSIAITDNTLLFDCTNKFLIHLFQKYLWNDGTPAPVGFPHSIGVFYGSKGPRTHWESHQGPGINSINSLWYPCIGHFQVTSWLNTTG